MELQIRVATLQDLEQIAPLFDAYRQFYGQQADACLARDFMQARLREGSSLVLLAAPAGGAAVAFTQLYPLFDSVGAIPSYILYDLFVAPGARRSGVARQLMQAAQREAARRGAGRLELQTARDNLPAQRLYEGLGWVRDNDFYVYAITP